MIEVSSRAFTPDGAIPSRYTCDGYGVSPPLSWSEVPQDAQSLAILVEDPDAGARPFVHWLVTDIPPDLHELEEGAALPRDANTAETDAGTVSYYGPCPVGGRHRYRFHIYALDTVLGEAPASRDDFLSAISGHVLDEGELVASYARGSA